MSARSWLQGSRFDVGGKLTGGHKIRPYGYTYRGDGSEFADVLTGGEAADLTDAVARLVDPPELIEYG